MAKIIVLDRQKEQMGYVEFIFTKGYSKNYIVVDISTTFAVSLMLQESTVFDNTNKAIASLYCGSNGNSCGGNVMPFGERLPDPGFERERSILGYFSGTKAYGDLDGFYKKLFIGEVSQNKVIRENKEIVGELSMFWGSEDEDYLQHKLQEDSKYSSKPAGYTQMTMKQNQNILYQTLFNIAGCASLITKLFEQKPG